jgi:hypothetical protein
VFEHHPHDGAVTVPLGMAMKGHPRPDAHRLHQSLPIPAVDEVIAERRNSSSEAGTSSGAES